MKMPWIRQAAASGTLALAVVGAAQPSSRRELAVPTEPVVAILNAFAEHQVVALGEGPHGNEQSHALRLSLLRHPRFAGVVNDIVVEFGSARYQDVMDRFVGGEDVPDAVLRKVWQDTTVPDYLWDKPIYEAFLREVRTLNASTSSGHRVRVLLGDPPIVWERVRDQVALWNWQNQRDRHVAELIQREVLAKKRRALVLYGDAHLAHRPGGQGLVGRLEQSNRLRVFAISRPIGVAPTSLQADVASWPIPSIARVRGTLVGAAEIEFERLPGNQWRPILFEDRFDAFLNMGGPLTHSRLSPSLCADTGYREMRLRRMALDPSDKPEELTQECTR